MFVNNPDTPDRELLQKMQDGNESAFEAIYTKYVRDVFRILRRAISSTEDCEEMVQEIFESLWTRRESLGHILDLKYYIFRMAKYKVVQYIRHNRVKRKYVEHYKIFEVAYDSIPEETRTVEQINEQMLTYIGTLPERCQEAFRMRILEHLSNAEIAERMNISKETAKNYLVAAFSHLRSLYDHIYKVG